MENHLLKGAHQRRHEPTTIDKQTGTSTDTWPHSADKERIDQERIDQENERFIQGEQLQHERRDERGYIRVAIPFRVIFADRSAELNGKDVSLGGFSVQSERVLEPGERIAGSLIMEVGNDDIIVSVKAECLQIIPTADGKGYDTSFRITEIAPKHRESLRQVIRSGLSGRPLDIQSQAGREDSQTPRNRQALNQGPTSRPPKPIGRYILLFLAIALLVLVSAATAYRNFMLIEPSFAAVTAPRIDIRAPSPGVLGEHDFNAGDQVDRDQLLTSVLNSELGSDLILAEAALNYNDRLIENLQDHLDGGNLEVSLANSAQPSSGDTMTFETVSPDIARARIEQFEMVRDYESSRIVALNAREVSNEIYSPCDCTVVWALSSAAGVYINESERIMTLVRTDEGDVMIEALVHMDDISRIEPDQQAYVTLANTTQPIRARVRNVALDIELQPRAGFPSWVRQQQNVASVLLVPEEPLPAGSVGQPVDVRFTETLLLSAVSEKTWQGVNWVIQSGNDLYDSAVNKINHYRNETDEASDSAVEETSSKG